MYRNRKSIYVWRRWIGGIGGPLFLVCLSGIFRTPISEGLAQLIAFVSLPVCYLLGNILDTNWIPLGILILIVYWAILGMVVVCGLVWLYFSILQRIGRAKESCGNSE